MTESIAYGRVQAHFRQALASLNLAIHSLETNPDMAVDLAYERDCLLATFKALEELRLDPNNPIGKDP